MSSNQSTQQQQARFDSQQQQARFNSQQQPPRLPLSMAQSISSSQGSKFQEWQPEQPKLNVHETINSDSEGVSSEGENVNDQEDIEPVHDLQETHVNHYSRPQENSLNNNINNTDQGMDRSYINNSQMVFHPVNTSQVKPFDGMSNTSSISKAQQQHKMKVYSFYYDRTGDQKSTLVPSELAPQLLRNILEQTVVPLLIALLVFIANHYIQVFVNDYCYIDMCACRTTNVRFWSFVRQMVMLKLAMVLYRRKILASVAMGSSTSKRRQPIIESVIFLSLVIGLDFIFVIWIQENQDWVYLILIYVITVTVMAGTFRMRDWVRVFYKGRAMFLYDAIYVALLMYTFYVMPDVLVRIQEYVGDITNGTSLFYYIYPFIDMTLEMLFDWVLGMQQLGELYIYQSQLILIGLRVGYTHKSNMINSILCLLSWYTIEFWYLLVMLGLFRVNNSSMVLTVFFRRLLYYRTPKCCHRLTYMEETPRTVKGKHGAYLEHLAWPIFFYFFYATNHTVPYYAKDETFIGDCAFDNPVFSQLTRWFQPLIVWGGMAIAEALGVLINQAKLKYDNIKWLGGTQFNALENTLIRIMGYYFFQMAFMIPFFVKSLNDLHTHQQHVLDQASRNYETL